MIERSKKVVFHLNSGCGRARDNIEKLGPEAALLKDIQGHS